ncbi:hypothetical protein BGW39_002118, partial [Mortierella sp. 14UC]
FKTTITSIILLATMMAVQAAPVIQDPNTVTIASPVAQAQPADANTQLATVPESQNVQPMMHWDTSANAAAADNENDHDHDHDDNENAKWGGWPWGCNWGWGNSWPWGCNWGRNWWCW